MRTTLKCRECQFQFTTDWGQIARASMDKHYRDHHPGQPTKYTTHTFPDSQSRHQTQGWREWDAKAKASSNASPDTTGDYQYYSGDWHQATKNGIAALEVLVAIQRQWTEWANRSDDGFPWESLSNQLSSQLQNFLFRLEALDLQAALFTLMETSQVNAVTGEIYGSEVAN
jgi:hypothetical protein